MVDRETVSTLDTNQIATTDLAGSPTPTNVPGPPVTAGSPEAGPLDPSQVPNPQEANREGDPETLPNAEPKGEIAPGIEGEQTVWEARYSMKNFFGRLAVRVLLSLGWIAMAVYAWGEGHPNAQLPTILLGILLGLFWLTLLYRIVRARYGHYYRLTNRRLFVTTGLFRRRCDQMELLHIKDVFLRESLLERWLSLGTVVVVSKESEVPTFYLAGVDEPKRVMDLVWHCARVEREGKAVQVDRV